MKEQYRYRMQNRDKTQVYALVMTVDIDWLVRQVGARAIDNKSKKSGALDGAVTVTATLTEDREL